ncbi:hypothetical protein HY640_02505 [Candidatus Woesearchaeota archaeon]|nr:hypothetical protein [Candidatus Woesearchaeota archaeon]
MTNSRKSQIEIMGLAIAIVLVIAGLLFAMKYLTKPPEDKTSASDRQIATAFLNTLLSDKLTVSDCKGLELKELFQDCAANTNTCSAGKTYCDKAKEVTGQILTNTLEKRGETYEFKIQVGTRPPESVRAKGCAAGSDKVQISYPLPTKQETVMLTLAMCN